MNEINIYQIDDVITKSVAPLIIKVLEEKKKALIYCADAAKLKEVDDSLWSYGKNKFIPHATLQDKEILEFGLQRQSIFLIDREENINEANYLILLNDASNAFVSGFERVFYFYESLDASKVKKFSQQFKKVNSYKKVDGKWVLNV